VYEGAFARDALHGHGGMAYPSGARYTGWALARAALAAGGA
jgi:hypothetical protein